MKSITANFKRRASQLPENFENRKLILSLVLALLTFGVAIVVSSIQIAKIRSKNISLAYSSLDLKGGLEAHSDIEQITSIAKKYSFLQPHLDGPLAQTLLNNGSTDQGEAIYQRVKKRLGASCEALQLFNEVTFLTAHQNYTQAHEISEQLLNREDFKKQPSLYAYHLVRHKALENQLGMISSKDLKASVTSLSREQQKTLSLGSLSLIDYLSMQNQ